MLSVRVDLKERGYDILVGSHLLKKAGEILKSHALGRDAVVVTNPVIERFHGKILAAGLRKHGFSVTFLSVPSGEKSKSARKAFELLQEIARLDVKKQIFIIAFGGGVVGDLAGFVAASYKRGVPYVQIPTTLLAQVDSAIGGKVAIDLPIGKNLAGAFYQPRLVLSDVATLSTLSRRQIRNGLSEAVKYGVIADRNLFNYIEEHTKDLLSGDTKILSEVVLNCSRIKARIVASDEKETKGIRTILNFGHTIGHAIEAANGYKNYHHGEAVALGMRVAAEISRRMGLLRRQDLERINNLLTLLGLPEKIRKVSVKRLFASMAHDKKFKASANRFVLAAGIGSVKVVERVNRRVIRAAIEACR